MTKSFKEVLLKQLSGEEDIDESCVRVILHHRNNANPDKTPITFVKKADLVDVVSNCIATERNTRKQFVVQIGIHYNAVDLSIDENGRAEMMIVDAANDFMSFSLGMALGEIENVDKVYFAKGNETTKGNPQKDRKSCFIFAICDAVALQSIDIYTHLKKDEVKKDQFDDQNKRPGILWTDMPPQFVVPSQSDTLWEYYKTKYQSTFNLGENALAEYSAYREEHKKKIREIDPNSEQSANIMPSVYQDMAAPVISYVENTSEDRLEHDIYSSEKEETQYQQMVL